MNRHGTLVARLVLLACAVLIAACGQRGDLYMPEPGGEVVPVAPASSPAGTPAGAQAPAAGDDDDQPTGNAARPAGAAR